MNLSSVMLEGIGTTIIGMGIVFSTLILIAFVINLLKFINKSENDYTDFEDDLPKSDVTSNIEQYKNGYESEEIDLSIVAAITSVIAVSLNTSTDKLRVVSIKRENSSNWKNISKKEQQRYIY